MNSWLFHFFSYLFNSRSRLPIYASSFSLSYFLHSHSIHSSLSYPHLIYFPLSNRLLSFHLIQFSLSYSSASVRSLLAFVFVHFPFHSIIASILSVYHLIYTTRFPRFVLLRSISSHFHLIHFPVSVVSRSQLHPCWTTSFPDDSIKPLNLFCSMYRAGSHQMAWNYRGVCDPVWLTRYRIPWQRTKEMGENWKTKSEQRGESFRGEPSLCFWPWIGRSTAFPPQEPQFRWERWRRRAVRAVVGACEEIVCVPLL